MYYGNYNIMWELSTMRSPNAMPVSQDVTESFYAETVTSPIIPEVLSRALGTVARQAAEELEQIPAPELVPRTDRVPAEQLPNMFSSAV